MTSARPAGLPRYAKALITLAIVAVVGLLVWRALPAGPYSTELQRIGQGRPALVLAYDIQSMGGMEVMAMMDTLRPQYEDRIEFLVAPLGAPHGRAFGERHNAVNGTVVLFAGSGQPVRTIHLPASTADLKQALQGLLSLSAPG